jgi:hypothetical protein
VSKGRHPAALVPYFQKKDILRYFETVKDSPAFDEVYAPGDMVKDDGIYGCNGPGCRYEVVRRAGEQLPFDLWCQMHLSGTTPRRHDESNVRWSLRALAQGNPDK